MAQQIRELMTSNPVSMPGTASVHEAARAMRDAGYWRRDCHRA